jgi:hypothetical protein
LISAFNALRCCAVQVRHLVHVVQGEEPEMQSGIPPVVDHPQTTAFTLPAPDIGEA